MELGTDGNSRRGVTKRSVEGARTVKTGILGTLTDFNDTSTTSSKSDEEVFDFHRGKNYYSKSLGVTIKKFKISNLSAIFILLAADLGIGYFTLPYVFNMDNICGKNKLKITILLSKLTAYFQLCLWFLFLLSTYPNLRDDQA